MTTKTKTKTRIKNTPPRKPAARAMKLSKQERSLIQLLHDWTRLPSKHHLDIRYNGDDEQWNVDLEFVGQGTGGQRTGGSFNEAWEKLNLTE
jgi:hypothetical protein